MSQARELAQAVKNAIANLEKLSDEHNLFHGFHHAVSQIDMMATAILNQLEPTGWDWQGQAREEAKQAKHYLDILHQIEDILTEPGAFIAIARKPETLPNLVKEKLDKIKELKDYIKNLEGELYKATEMLMRDANQSRPIALIDVLRKEFQEAFAALSRRVQDIEDKAKQQPQPGNPDGYQLTTGPELSAAVERGQLERIIRELETDRDHWWKTCFSPDGKGRASWRQCPNCKNYDVHPGTNELLICRTCQVNFAKNDTEHEYKNLINQFVGTATLVIQPLSALSHMLDAMRVSGTMPANSIIREYEESCQFQIDRLQKAINLAKPQEPKP